ncbi:MAG: YqgE/AlgH family protein [Hyphomicrobiaceae bacterium]
MKIAKKTSRAGTGISLTGQLLAAMPLMSDSRFARSVIYMCAHSEEGAMGLIINRRAPDISLRDLLRQLKVVKGEGKTSVPAGVLAMAVHIGGPVETGRGFVLHTIDYFAADSTLPIADGVGLTATVDILKAMAAGQGPHRSLLALGYAGWAPGQLEDEFQANGWLHCAADTDLIFDDNVEQKYGRVLSKLGIDPSHLVSEAGHA